MRRYNHKYKKNPLFYSKTLNLIFSKDDIHYRAIFAFPNFLNFHDMVTKLIDIIDILLPLLPTTSL